MITLERVRACESATRVEKGKGKTRQGGLVIVVMGIVRPAKSWAPLAATVLATALLLQPIHAEGKNLRILRVFFTGRERVILKGGDLIARNSLFRDSYHFCQIRI